MSVVGKRTAQTPHLLARQRASRHAKLAFWAALRSRATDTQSEWECVHRQGRLLDGRIGEANNIYNNHSAQVSHGWRRNEGIVGNNVGLKHRSATIDPLDHTTLWPEIDVKGEHAAAVDTSVCQPSPTLPSTHRIVTSVGLRAK